MIRQSKCQKVHIASEFILVAIAFILVNYKIWPKKIGRLQSEKEINLSSWIFSILATLSVHQCWPPTPFPGVSFFFYFFILTFFCLLIKHTFSNWHFAMNKATKIRQYHKMCFTYKHHPGRVGSLNPCTTKKARNKKHCILNTHKCVCM